jgi:hypothetical protein
MTDNIQVCVTYTSEVTSVVRVPRDWSIDYTYEIYERN